MNRDVKAEGARRAGPEFTYLHHLFGLNLLHARPGRL